MRVIAVVLLLVIAASMGAAEKAPKEPKASKGLKAAKEGKPAKPKKRFEAVTVQNADVVGHYRGPAETYGLTLEVGPDGTLRGQYVEMGRVAVLESIVLEGADFTARARFDDGTSRTITGSFANRIRDGITAFGIRMRDVPVEGHGPVQTFFERY